MTYEDVLPVSMGSAGLKYGADGRVAWNRSVAGPNALVWFREIDHARERLRHAVAFRSRVGSSFKKELMEKETFA
jgi:hypothetical protein